MDPEIPPKKLEPPHGQARRAPDDLLIGEAEVVHGVDQRLDARVRGGPVPGVAVVGAVVVGVVVSVVTVLGMAVLGVAFLGVAFLSIAVLGIPFLSVAFLSVGVLSVVFLGIAILSMAVLLPVRPGRGRRGPRAGGRGPGRIVDGDTSHLAQQ